MNPTGLAEKICDALVLVSQSVKAPQCARL